jgi:phosphotransferase system  glucose/maltose/N-acetylglucosamine-specific IIC component
VPINFSAYKFVSVTTTPTSELPKYRLKVFSAVLTGFIGPMLLEKYTEEPRFYFLAIYVFPPFATFFSGSFNFPIFPIPQFYISKISNFPPFTSLEHLQREQF